MSNKLYRTYSSGARIIKIVGMACWWLVSNSCRQLLRIQSAPCLWNRSKRSLYLVGRYRNPSSVNGNVRWTYLQPLLYTGVHCTNSPQTGSSFRGRHLQLKLSTHHNIAIAVQNRVSRKQTSRHSQQIQPPLSNRLIPPVRLYTVVSTEILNVSSWRTVNCTFETSLCWACLSDPLYRNIFSVVAPAYRQSKQHGSRHWASYSHKFHPVELEYR